VPPSPPPLEGVDAEAIAILTKFCQLTEDLALKAYPDPLSPDGIPVTIAFGSTRNLEGAPWRIGDRITEKEAIALLTRDATDAYMPCSSIPYWAEMTAHQRAALADLNFNEGYTYGDGDHDALDGVLKFKNWDKFGAALQLYDNKDSLGLSRRRYAEWLMFSQNLGPKEAYFLAWRKESVAEIMEAIAL
jgi:GH24 family phage-related lysozyme (muramidase)